MTNKARWFIEGFYHMDTRLSALWNASILLLNWVQVPFFTDATASTLFLSFGGQEPLAPNHLLMSKNIFIHCEWMKSFSYLDSGVLITDYKIKFNSYKVFKRHNQNIKSTCISEVLHHSCFTVVFDLSLFLSYYYWATESRELDKIAERLLSSKPYLQFSQDEETLIALPDTSFAQCCPDSNVMKLSGSSWLTKLQEEKSPFSVNAVHSAVE